MRFEVKTNTATLTNMDLKWNSNNFYELTTLAYAELAQFLIFRGAAEYGPTNLVLDTEHVGVLVLEIGMDDWKLGSLRGNGNLVEFREAARIGYVEGLQGIRISKSDKAVDIGVIDVGGRPNTHFSFGFLFGIEPNEILFAAQNARVRANTIIHREGSLVSILGSVETKIIIGQNASDHVMEAPSGGVLVYPRQHIDVEKSGTLVYERIWHIDVRRYYGEGVIRQVKNLPLLEVPATKLPPAVEAIMRPFTDRRRGIGR
jgi:hypothetical protein